MLRVAAAGLALNLGGCSSSPTVDRTNGTDTVPGSASTADIPSYTDALFETLVGVPLEEVSGSVTSKKRKVVGECLQSRGFQEYASGGPLEHLELVPPQIGGYPSYLAERIRLEDADGISSMSAPSMELERAWTECESEADAEVPDPVAIYSKWLSVVGADLEGRLKADNRYIDAALKRSACFAEAGYSEAEDDPLIMPAISIYNEFRRGALTAAEAVRDLQALSESESPIVQLASKCNDEFLVTRGAVFDELLNEYLDHNAEILSEVKQDLEDTLEPYLVGDE